MSTLSATVERVEFRLVEDGGRYRWLWPNGSPTDLTADSVAQARRSFAFRGMGLAIEWKQASRELVPG